MELILWISLCFTLLIVVVVSPVIGSRVIDMTYDLDENAITWPMNPRFKLTIMHRGFFEDTGIWVENNKIDLPEHTGTHLDAPAHFGQGKWRIHNIPLEKLMGPGVIIDVKDKVKTNIDYAVTIEDVTKWEEKYGNIPSGAVVLMNSGWKDRYGNFQRAYNTTDILDTTSYHNPGWHVDTVKWLLNKRDINVLGADTPSFDLGKAVDFPVHQVLLKANKCGVENAGYLDRVPESGAMIYISAIKIKDGSGAPVRMFAIVDASSRTAPGFVLLIGTTVCAAVFYSLNYI